MLATHKGEIPFFILLIPFIAGIACALWIPALSASFATAATLMLIVLFILLNVFYLKLKSYNKQWTGGVLINLIVFSSAIICTVNHNELNKTDHFSKFKADYLVARISNEPKVNGDVVKFSATVIAMVSGSKKSNATGNLLITIQDSTAKKLYYGDELLIPASYTAVDPPFNPAEFNYKKYLANQNIHFQIYLRSKQFTVICSNSGNSIIAYSLRLRQQLVEKFRRNMHNPEAIAVASTLILGYKADLSNEVLQAYSKTGTIHVLSVSGAHVAIIYVLLNFLLTFLDRYKHGRIIKTVTIITLIWYYSLLTGFSPAVCRAAIMIGMVITAQAYSRYVNTLNILAASAFFQLIYDPYLITDVGFQLSYLAVFGLVVLQPVVYKLVEYKNKWADRLWMLCSASIAAQVITFPLSAFYFHQFPVYFLISNLFMLIPSTIIMYTGVAYLLLPQIPFLSAALGFVLEHTILLTNKALAFIEYLPFASIGKIWFTRLEYTLLYVIIISIFYLLFKPAKWILKGTIAGVLLLSISVSFKRWEAVQSSDIVFLNLRKHSGLICRDGNRAVVVSDLADTDKNYKYSIQPYLDSCKISRVKSCNLNNKLTLSYFRMHDNLIQFRGTRIILIDKDHAGIRLPEKFSADYLFVTGNPHVDVNYLNQNYNFQLLVIDGNNSNMLCDKLKNEASLLHIKFKVLKRNNSLRIISKDKS